MWLISLHVTVHARDPVTPEVLHNARYGRNAIWIRVKPGVDSPDAVANEYEARVGAADGVADRRYVGAKDVEHLETLRGAIEKSNSSGQGPRQSWFGIFDVDRTPSFT